MSTDISNGTASRVLGIGQCSWDYLAFIDRYPEPDTKLEVAQWLEAGGGPVATALVALSRFGVDCRFCGVVGSDGAGEKIIAELVSADIDVAGLRRRNGEASQTAFIAVEKGSGRRTIYWHRAGGGELRPAEIPGTAFDGVNFLHLDGLMIDVSRWALHEARRRGIPVMLDAGRVRPGMLELARECDYVVASEQFACDLGWTGDAAHFRTVAEGVGRGVLTVTLGAAGSVTYHDGGYFPVPAFPVPVVDTTGAGDVFHGGYLYGLLQGWDLRRSVIYASAVAALKCTRPGGRAGIPNLDEAREFLVQRGFR